MTRSLRYVYYRVKASIWTFYTTRGAVRTVRISRCVDYCSCRVYTYVWEVANQWLRCHNTQLHAVPHLQFVTHTSFPYLKVLGRRRGHFVASNPDCLCHVPLQRYWPQKLPLSCEVVENRYIVFGPEIFIVFYCRPIHVMC